MDRRRVFRRRRAARGYTLIEMVVVCVVLVILAAVTLPVAKFSSRREKEMDLRQALRTMRNAIDEHKRYCDAGLIPRPPDVSAGCYPLELEDLVDGVDIVGQIDMKKKFLRRIPTDPMTGEAEWGMRSYQDEPDTTSWGGENVFDVYSLSEGVGLDGKPYSEW